MSTKIIVLSILLFFSSLSYSQIIKSIGFKSGLALSNQKWEYSTFTNELITNQLTCTYNVITIDFIKKQNWDLALDLGFYQSGSIKEKNPYFHLENTKEYAGEVKHRFGFFTLSPILRFKTQIKSFTPYIQFGPRFDFYNSFFSNDYADYFNNEINKTQYGFHIGEGLAYNFKNFSILAEYQFFYNFNKLMDKPAIFPSNTFKRDVIKFNTHIISLGIKYYFKNEE
jgi:opacity protein-like surface antigen